MSQYAELTEKMLKLGDWLDVDIGSDDPAGADCREAAAALKMIADAEAERDKLREALLPFAQFAVNTDENGWLSNIHREAISTWFGPTAFREADAALNSSQSEANP
jgi:hypothetical protein